MALSDAEKNYSNQLFKQIHGELGRLFKDQLPSCQFRGTWAFFYFKGANTLRSCAFELADGFTVADAVRTEILENTFLDTDFGSLGNAFSQLVNNNNESKVAYLRNTFDDPSGVVCYYDSLIGQEHAFFVLIKHEEKVLGMLDIFFSGEMSVDDCENIKRRIESGFSYVGLHGPTINAFMIREHEDLLKIQRDEQVELNTGHTTDHRIRGVVDKISRIMTVSSLTPVFYIRDQNQQLSAGLIGLNFDFIHTLIKHELRFCPLTKEEGCFHSAQYSSFGEEDLYCDNLFLKTFYYDVLKRLNGRVVEQSFELHHVSYKIAFHFHRVTEEAAKNILEEIIADLQSSGAIEKDIETFTESYEPRIRETAKAKLQDELVFIRIKDRLVNNTRIEHSIDVAILYRLDPQYLSYEHPCRLRNNFIDDVKRFISPTSLLPKLQMESSEIADLGLTVCCAEKLTVSDIEIIDKDLFIEELKKSIASDPEAYIPLLAPYLTWFRQDTGNSNYDTLSIRYAGGDVLDKHNPYLAVIKGQLSLMLALLRTKEISSMSEETLRHARKAAIAQIMLRNMSHNIGSHVLANLTDPKAILELAIRNKHNNLNRHEELNRGRLTYRNSEQQEIKVNSNPTSFNVAMAELSGYMRTRMDFLADISTGTAVIETTKELASEVVTPLNERIMLLKTYITGNKKIALIRNPLDSLIAAFPNDSLGVQGLYVIVENVIRNSAKHARGDLVAIDWKSRSNLFPDLIELVLFDCNDKQSEKDLEKLVNDQNSRIDKQLLEKNGSLRNGSWGMLEMKIASAYIRKIAVDRIDDPFDPPLLTAVPVDNDGDHCLGYQFYLLKPKRVLVVLPDEKEIPVNKAATEHGIAFIHWSALQNNDDIYNQDIVLLVGREPMDISLLSKQLSTRTVAVEPGQFDEQVKAGPTVFIEWAWKAWFRTLVDQTNPVIVSQEYDDDDSPTQTVSLGTPAAGLNGVHASFVYHCKTFREQPDYFEPYSALHAAQKQIRGLTDDCEYELKARFVETINYTVAIADERIQKHGNMIVDTGIEPGDKKHADFLAKCGIEMPPIQIDLNAESFRSLVAVDDQENTIKRHLENWLEEKSATCDFVVLHIGIIERMLELETITDDKKLEWIQSYLFALSGVTNQKAKIVIISGRGQPESLPKGELFIHYSNIAQYVIERPSKFHLMQLLMSARKIK